jgi:hypothetical protein
MFQSRRQARRGETAKRHRVLRRGCGWISSIYESSGRKRRDNRQRHVLPSERDYQFEFSFLLRDGDGQGRRWCRLVRRNPSPCYGVPAKENRTRIWSCIYRAGEVPEFLPASGRDFAQKVRGCEYPKSPMRRSMPTRMRWMLDRENPRPCG